MTSNNSALAAPRPTPRPLSRPIPPARLEWLAGEVAAWRAEGLLEEPSAAAILGRYRPTHRLSLARLTLGLGATFVGVGLIWLVAANLDQLPPGLRFGLVALIWALLLAGGEALALRRAHRGTVPSPVVGAARVMAALAFGGVVFQAAQSLQVPAYQPILVGLWSLGALAQAYLLRSVGAQVVGLLAGLVWVVFQTVQVEPSPFGVVLALLAAGVLGAGIAVVHDRGLTEFGPPWREVSAGLLLAGLFAAALPFVTVEDFGWTPALVVMLTAAGLASVAGLVLAPGKGRLEPVAALGILATSVFLVRWESGTDPFSVAAADWAHAAVSVTAYVAAAGWVAVLAILRNSGRLTALALGAVVVFTTFQAFAVFARIIEGAWLFVVLGLIFLGTGYLFDRARRELAATWKENDDDVER